ncbi:MAG: TolC family protein [Kiritimatiellae bacterium]|nr:TolC family protein [Kiritimatiellia bacterium]
MNVLVRGTLVFLAALAWGGLQNARAQEPADSFTLQQLVDGAMAANPQLRSGRGKWDAARERPAQAGVLANPRFTYKGMDDTSSIGNFPNTEEKRFELEQAFPWFGKNTLREHVAVQEARAVEQDYGALVRETVREVKETYYELRAVRQVMTITHKEAAVLQQLESVIRTVYASGKAPQVDVLKAQAEQTMLSQRLLEYETRDNSLQSKLNVLMDRDPGAPLALAENPSPFAGGPESTLDQLLGLAARQRAEIARAQAELERARAVRRLTAREYFPDYSLGLEYRAFRDSPDMAMFMIGVDLPVWQGKYRAGVREAEKMMAANEAALDAVRNQVRQEVQQAQVNVVKARQSLHLYQQALIPQAIERFNASEAGYRTGQVGFLDLLESERFLLNARSMTALAEGNVGVQLARLEQAVGGRMSSNAVPGETSK